MANHKRKPNYKAKRSCGLCKPWKRIGNSKKMEDRRAILIVNKIPIDKPLMLAVD